MKGKSFNDIVSALSDEPLRRVLAKVPEWSGIPGLVVPDSLCAQQCSSSAAASFKATVAASFAGQSPGARLLDGVPSQQSPGARLLTAPPSQQSALRIADLTGGLGVDSYYFSKVFAEVLYCERNTALFEAVRSNFAVLGCSNVKALNCTVDSSSEQMLCNFAPDIIYLDPARRDSTGKKVFLLEDCEPDLLGLLPMLGRICSKILVKVSPMADISMLHSRLGSALREVHIVQVDSEAKELLLLLDLSVCATVTGGPIPTVAQRATVRPLTRPTVAENPTVGRGVPLTVVKLATVGKEVDTLRLADDDLNGIAKYLEDATAFSKGSVLYEPGPALSKAGAFRWISGKFGATKIGVDAHLYVVEPNSCEQIAPFGKMFTVIECLPLNNQTIKDLYKSYSIAEVSARGLKMTSDQLRIKLKVKSGGDIHIFGVATPRGNLLIVCKRLNGKM